MILECDVLPPEWIRRLVDDVIRPAVTAYGPIGTLGYAFTPPDHADATFDAWELCVYPSPNELVGGAYDGAMSVCGFALNLGVLIENANPVESVVWHSPTGYNGFLDGPEARVVGTYSGRRVVIRFFHVPPPDEPPAYRMDSRTGAVTEARLSGGAV